MPTQLTWNQYEQVKDIVQYYVDEFIDENPDATPEEIESFENQAYNRDISDEISWAWEDFLAGLDEMMSRLDNPDGLWVGKGRNLGWRGTGGEAEFSATNGQELLAAVLPDTENTFTVSEYPDHLEINNFHHDTRFTGTGGEWYEIYPATYFSIYEDGYYIEAAIGTNPTDIFKEYYPNGTITKERLDTLEGTYTVDGTQVPVVIEPS